MDNTYKDLYFQNIIRHIYPLCEDTLKFNNKLITRNLINRTEYYLKSHRKIGNFGGKILLERVLPFTILNENLISDKNISKKRKKYVLNPIKDINEYEFYQLDTDQWNSIVFNKEMENFQHEETKKMLFKFVKNKTNINLLKFVKYKAGQNFIKLLTKTTSEKSNYKEIKDKNTKTQPLSCKRDSDKPLASHSANILISNIVKLNDKNTNLKLNLKNDTTYNTIDLISLESQLIKYKKNENVLNLFSKDKCLNESIERFSGVENSSEKYKFIKLEKEINNLRCTTDLSAKRTSHDDKSILRQNANISFTVTIDNKFSTNKFKNEDKSLISLSFPSYDVSLVYEKDSEIEIIKPHLVDRQEDTISDTSYLELNNANLTKYSNKFVFLKLC